MSELPIDADREPESPTVGGTKPAPLPPSPADSSAPVAEPNPSAPKKRGRPLGRRDKTKRHPVAKVDKLFKSSSKAPAKPAKVASPPVRRVRFGS